MGFGKFWMKYGLGAPGSIAKTMTKCYLINKAKHPSLSNEQLLALTLESRILAQFQAKKVNALQPRDEEGRNITELELIQKHSWDLKELILYVIHCEISEVNNACLKFPDLYQELIEIIDEVVNKYLKREDAVLESRSTVTAEDSNALYDNYYVEEEQEDVLCSDSKESNRVLSVSQVLSMTNTSISMEEDWGFYGYSTINHSYHSKSINGDKIVIDHATGLMWHQSGSNECMHWNDVNEWVNKLNEIGYAGYQDWILPTVEAAVSLLESSRRIDNQQNLYIDSVFSNKQTWIWTSDKSGSEATWSVGFDTGFVSGTPDYYDGFVRPVRSLK